MITPLLFRKVSPTTASPEALMRFGNEFGLRLPETLVEFCTKWNGGYPSLENTFYPVPIEFSEFHKEYGPTNAGITVDGLYGITDSFPSCSMKDEMLSLNQVSQIRILPIAYDLLGNHVVVRIDSPEGPVLWSDHELWEAPERPYLIPVAEDLEHFYNLLTTNPYSSE